MDLILHTILPFAGVLIVLIVVHELGHYITAKLTGVKVLEAGLGASLAIRLNVGETVDFNVKHSDGVVENIPVHARWTPPEGQGPTGIQIASQGGKLPLPVKEYGESSPPWEAIPKGWTATIDSLILARNEVISMVKGGSGPEVTGPVGPAQATGGVGSPRRRTPSCILSA